MRQGEREGGVKEKGTISSTRTVHVHVYIQCIYVLWTLCSSICVGISCGEEATKKHTCFVHTIMTCTQSNYMYMCIYMYSTSGVSIVDSDH